MRLSWFIIPQFCAKTMQNTLRDFLLRKKLYGFLIWAIIKRNRRPPRRQDGGKT